MQAFYVYGRQAHRAYRLVGSYQGNSYGLLTGSPAMAYCTLCGYFPCAHLDEAQEHFESHWPFLYVTEKLYDPWDLIEEEVRLRTLQERRRTQLEVTGG